MNGHFLEPVDPENQRVGLDIPTKINNNNQFDTRARDTNSPIRLERWNAFDEIEHVDEQLLNEWKRDVPEVSGTKRLRTL